MFVRSGVLPVNMLYFKYTANPMRDITTNRTPFGISESFIRSDSFSFILTILDF